MLQEKGLHDSLNTWSGACTSFSVIFHTFWNMEEGFVKSMSGINIKSFDTSRCVINFMLK